MKNDIIDEVVDPCVSVLLAIFENKFASNEDKIERKNDTGIMLAYMKQFNDCNVIIKKSLVR